MAAVMQLLDTRPFLSRNPKMGTTVADKKRFKGAGGRPTGHLFTTLAAFNHRLSTIMEAHAVFFGLLLIPTSQERDISAGRVNALWYRTTENRSESTGLLAHPLARSLLSLIHSLTPHCLLHL